MKYSIKFERDYNFYLNNINNFTFSGSLNRTLLIDLDKGLSAKECFYKLDSTGMLFPTKEPDLLFKIFKCKESVNFQIKEWSKDRAKGYLPKIEFDEIVKEYNLLDWIIKAVEQQKYKYYE
jgi:hypothetical protein